MSADHSPALESNEKENKDFATAEPNVVLDGYSVAKGSDILGLQDVDPALNAKMHLVNNVNCPQDHSSKEPLTR